MEFIIYVCIDPETQEMAFVENKVFEPNPESDPEQRQAEFEAAKSEMIGKAQELANTTGQLHQLEVNQGWGWSIIGTYTPEV